MKSLINYKDFYNGLLSEITRHDRIYVPPEPGTKPIPHNHLRLYHYTDPECLDDIRKHGLQLKHAKGHTYHEPNFIWASLSKPRDFKTFIEFSVAINDPRLTQFGGAKPREDLGVEFYKNRGSDFTFSQDITPNDFIDIHEPWHHPYRYITQEGTNIIEEVLNGKFDYLLEKESTPNEAKAILAIKQNYSL